MLQYRVYPTEINLLCAVCKGECGFMASFKEGDQIILRWVECINCQCKGYIKETKWKWSLENEPGSNDRG